jgi:cadmium resistance protein CadD (predicted permease)
MSLCASGILVAALTFCFLLMDLSYGQLNYFIEHLLLGGGVTLLFFSMCSYGYEMVNWGLLSLMPIYIILRLIYIIWFQDEEDSSEDDECCACKKRRKTCGCPEPRKYHC